MGEGEVVLVEDIYGSNKRKKRGEEEDEEGTENVGLRKHSWRGGKER